MANGKPSGPESYVLRSGVRIGLKREFAFALKSQADIPNSLSRTRSGRAAVAVYRSRSAKLPRKSNDFIEKQMKSRLDKTMAEASMGLCSIPLGGATADVTVADTINDESEKDGLSLFTRISCDSNEGVEDIIAQERPISIHKVYEKKDTLKKSEHLPPALSFPPYQIVSAFSEECMVSSSQLENGIVMERAMVSNGFSGSAIDDKLVEEPTERLTLLDLKSIPVTASPLIAEQEENLMEVMPVLENYLGVEQKENLVEIPITLDELGGLEFGNGNLDGSIKAAIEGPVVVTMITESDDVVDEVDCVTPLEKPARSFMGSSLNFAIETSSVVEGSTYISGDAAESDKLKVLSGSLSMTPKKKMELKMSKKITLTKLPSNVRHLLGTGLLEGLPVKYISCIGKIAGLNGVIRGNGILCSCISCQGAKVVSAYQFEIHAGSTKKHPSDFIFLENGKSLRDVLKSCTDAPLDMLEAAIQNEIGPIPPKSLSICQKCKVVFDTVRAGNFALLCDSCLETQPATPSSSYGITNPAKSSKKVGTPFASDGKPKNTSSQKKLSHGKITRKDLGLHKLVFMDDILPQGTEVGYYVRGKRLLEGYIKDSGIFCCCCNSVVSPSQFEAHAGQSSRRKPYNYIYTSNGVSLHELSVSLSKGRKLSATENDDLCGICADGGNLLLCDLCPRAFHRECLGLSSIPNESWFCQYCENLHQKEKHLAHNDNAIAAGRMAGVDPIEQIITRCIRIVTTPENDAGVCALCRQHSFSRTGFDQLTVIICDQCETEYHVGCLKVNDMADLKELPEGEWFCRPECSRIHSTLHELLLQEPLALEESDAGIIQKKLGEKGLSKDAAVDVKWRLLSGKNDSAGSKLLLSQAVSLFRESFDPIVEPISGRDLVPFMVYGRNMRDQDFGGMYCMVLTMNSSVISAGLLRVLGCEVAELPLVATKKENQGLGFFQSLFSCIVRLFKSLKVKHFVLPAAADAESIWTKRFGFSNVTPTQLREYAKGARPMTFQGTSMLHKPVFGQHELSDEGTFKPPT